MKEVRDISRSLKAKNRYWHKKRWAIIALQFAILFAFWLVLSRRYEAKYLYIGALSAGLVTFLTHDFLYPRTYPGKKRETSLLLTLSQWARFLGYLPWLLLSIVKANLQVAYLILHPQMPIDPAFIKFRTQLRSKVAHVTLANSITLTPGTLTVDLEEGCYIVHALTPQSAQGLLTGQMQNKVGAIFGEKAEQPPRVLWGHSVEEVED